MWQGVVLGAEAYYTVNRWYERATYRYVSPDVLGRSGGSNLLAWGGTLHTETNPTGYRCRSRTFNDCIMRKAVDQTPPSRPYRLLGKPGPVESLTVRIGEPEFDRQRAMTRSGPVSLGCRSVYDLSCGQHQRQCSSVQLRLSLASQHCYPLFEATGQYCIS